MKESIKEPPEDPLPMETEEEEPKVEPIKELIKEVKDLILLQVKLVLSILMDGNTVAEKEKFKFQSS